jgi:hypothetical protein
MEYSKKFGIPGFPQSFISAVYLFVGEHFNSIEEMMFDHMSVEHEELNHWLDISGFEKPHNDKENDETTIKYKKPENIILNVNTAWQIEIAFTVFWPGPWFIPVEKAEIRQVPRVVFKPRQKESFDSFQSQLHKINSFLTICYFTFPKFQAWELYKKNENKADERDNDFIKIEVLFQHRVDYDNYKIHDSRHAFLITYADMNGNFEAILSKWFELSDKITASINILTDCFMNRKGPVEFYFLGLAQAIENMHRRLGKTDIVFLKRIKEMIANLPPNISEALLSNEPKFADRIKENRNYFTHYDEKLDAKKAPLGELFFISEKMKIILIVNLIKELGFTDEETNKIILGKSVWLFNHLIKIDTEN